jgi:TonB family protein
MTKRQWLAFTLSVGLHALLWLSFGYGPSATVDDDNVIAFTYREGAPQAARHKVIAPQSARTKKASPLPAEITDEEAIKTTVAATEIEPRQDDGETNLEEADLGRAPTSPAEQYLAAIRKQVLTAQAYPKASRIMREEGVVKIRLTLLRDGSLQMIELVAPSAFKRLNDAAVHAASHSTPFPAFPAQVPYQVWKIVLPIRFKLEAT